MKATATNFNGWQRPVRWQAFRHEKPIIFGDSGQVCPLWEETIAHFSDTGKPCFIRLKFHWPSSPVVVSKEYQFEFKIWHGGAGVAIKKNAGPVYLEAVKLDKPQLFHGYLHPYRVDLFQGKHVVTNLNERFYFPCVPLEVDAFKKEKRKLNWLAKMCVADFLEREKKQQVAEAKQFEAEKWKATPANFSHEDKEIDHHKNWLESVEKLLKKKWPNLTAAFMAYGGANTEVEKLNFLAAYVADYTAIFGKAPDVKPEDAAELVKDASFITLMHKANTAPGSPVDAIHWRLAIGWLEKGYYRMNEKQLEEAFNRDWNYQPGEYKGNTLAKYAREKLGLLFALKRGRPEERPFDDSALPPA